MRVKRIEKVDKNCRRNKMFPVYEQKKENVHILQKTSRHAPPHLHNSVEFIYVISGSMEIGMLDLRVKERLIECLKIGLG